MSLKIGVKSLFLLVLPAILLLSCAETKYVYKTDIEYVLVKPSNVLLEECKPLPSKEIKTNGDLLLAYHDLMLEYVICSNKILSIKQFFLEYKDNNN